jgi:hypothetical protein
MSFNYIKVIISFVKNIQLVRELKCDTGICWHKCARVHIQGERRARWCQKPAFCLIWKESTLKVQFIPRSIC